tara:strand:- start:707 stop:1279 length:573 start_codon:yes stop_codon:yes gene_type:complete
MAVSNAHSVNTTERNGSAVVGAPRGANQSANTSRYRLNTAGEYAQAVITFNGVPAVDQTIIIIDHAGTSKTYTAKGSETAASLQFNQASTAAAAATSLKACIVHANGHNGTITVDDDTAGRLIITQTVLGQMEPSTRRVITSTLANVGAEDFLGGKFGSGVNDAPDVAGQHTKYAERWDDPRYYSGDTTA